MLSPGYLVFWGLFDDYWYYAQMMYQSGLYSIQLLIITVAVTPALMLISWIGYGKALGRWLLIRRKHFGLGSFVYAVAHLLHYVLHEDTWKGILTDVSKLEFTTGWIALLIFAALAATSNRWSSRRLGANWKKLHLWIYPASAAVYLHWYLFDQYTARVMFWLGIFAAVKLAHILMRDAQINRRRPKATG